MTVTYVLVKKNGLVGKRVAVSRENGNEWWTVKFYNDKVVKVLPEECMIMREEIV